MKKLFVLLSLLILVAALLCGCAGKSEKAEPLDVQVGFGRADITPTTPVGLAGFGNATARVSTEAEAPLYATCIAFRQGEETALLFTCDTIRITTTMSDPTVEKITQSTGVPADRIFFSATHTHSGPDTYEDVPGVPEFLALFADRAHEAAQAAIADLADASLYGTTVTIPYTYVRHYLMADGTYAGDNFGSFNGTIKDYATEADQEAQIVRFDRGEGKTAIVLMNWQGHPTFTSDRLATVISPDIVGTIRKEFEDATGLHFAYFTGASGNQNMATRIPGDPFLRNHTEGGEKIANMVIDALKKEKPVSGTGLQVDSRQYTYKINHAFEENLEEIQKVVDAWVAFGKSNSAIKGLLMQLGLSSGYQANAILRRSKLPESGELTVSALRVGGMAFITAPYEMFAESGRYIKGNSPFDLTFICTCANGADNQRYAPSSAAYDYGSYEAATTDYVKGTAEELQELHVTMLKGLMPAE